VGLLGDVTAVSAQTGRKVNNALTVTFKTSPEDTLATAVQAGSIGVLLGFRNGGSGRYKLSVSGGAELTVDCANPRTKLTDGAGQVLGTLEKDATGDGVLLAGDGTVLARAAAQPKDKNSDFEWQHPLTGPDGQVLGQLTWVRARPVTGWDVVNGINDMYVWWDKAGESLKVPSLGAHLTLDHPVPPALGDLLLATCVDITVGSKSFVQP
jgi:hypothetical protein